MTKWRATERNRKIQFKIVRTRLYEWIILFHHLPGSCEFAYCMYHSSAELTFSFSILKWFIQRCSKNILNLVAMQYAHPFTPERCTCSLHSKRPTQNRKENRKEERLSIGWSGIDSVVSKQIFKWNYWNIFSYWIYFVRQNIQY